MGLYWGHAVSQNAKGHLIGHVKVCPQHLIISSRLSVLEHVILMDWQRATGSCGTVMRVRICLRRLVAQVCTAFRSLGALLAQVHWAAMANDIGKVILHGGCICTSLYRV